MPSMTALTLAGSTPGSVIHPAMLGPSRKLVTLSNRLNRAATPKPRPLFDAGRRLGLCHAVADAGLGKDILGAVRLVPQLTAQVLYGSPKQFALP